MKQVKEIETPEGWRGFDDYSSHREMLWIALSKTDGGVIELGSGVGSTALLKQYCMGHHRTFWSYDSNKEWCEKTGAKYIEDWNTDKRWLQKVSVAFVDHSPGEHRKEAIEMLREFADVIVLHDSEPGAQGIYGITEVLTSFKYRLDFRPLGMPHTTALSDKINVEQWV